MCVNVIRTQKVLEYVFICTYTYIYNGCLPVYLMSFNGSILHYNTIQMFDVG